MAQISIDEFVERISKLAGVVGNIAEYTVVPSGREMLAEIKARVLKEGKNSDNQKIGDYSTKPIYASKEAFVKKGSFQARGKKGDGANMYNVGDRLIPTPRTKTNSTKANRVRYGAYTVAKPDYTPRKTMYLPNGYKELREVQGLEVAYIDFKYSGQLVKDYQVKPTENAALLGITTGRSAKVYTGLTNRFGDFYQPTVQEQKRALERTTFRIARILRDVLIDGASLDASITVQTV